MIFGYRQRIFPNKKLPYQGQKSCRKILWILNTLPNGVTHLTMLLIDIKILQNRAGKNYGF